MKIPFIITSFILVTFHLTAQNVGIGTTTPSKPLDIALPGGIQISRTENGSVNNEIFFSDNGQIRSLDDNHRIVFNRSNDQLEFNELGKILFLTGNPLTEAMRITGNGYIGIGTTLPLTPNNLLSVAGGITIDYNNQNNGTIANVLSFGSSGGEGIGSARVTFPLPVNSHGLDFYTNYTKRISIDAGGNVGIGTATPTAKLDVEGNVKIIDGTQGNGKILTSDADGNAYWSGVVACSAANCCGTTSNDTLHGNSGLNVVYKSEYSDIGGDNYDPSTGIFTAPITGVYHVSTNVSLDRISGSNNSSTALSFALYINGTLFNPFNGTVVFWVKGDENVIINYSGDVNISQGDKVGIHLSSNSSDTYKVEDNGYTTKIFIHLVK